MKRKVDKMSSKGMSPSYKEPMRPTKPNTTHDKGKPQDQKKGKRK